ncbi:MAG: hypothetical protein OXU61_13115 [Gammaproteobacteria bacterium]|nr:hypothetical protein [Gammaproteobacteria bacterium]
MIDHGMTQVNIELLDALRDAGASDDKARAAAQSVAVVNDMATRADVFAAREDISAVREDLCAVREDISSVRAEMAAQEARLTWRMAGGIAVILAAMALFDLN